MFELLGYFYRDVQQDRARGRKCFEKSFELDKNNDRSGAALCDMLTDDGKEVWDTYKLFTCLIDALYLCHISAI